MIRLRQDANNRGAAAMPDRDAGRCARLWPWLACGLTLALASPTPAQEAADGEAEAALPGDPQARVDPIVGDEYTEQSRRAVERGLAWLAGQQNDDGTFGRGGGGMGSSSGITGIGGLALMSSGSLPDRGPYGLEVRRAVDAVMAQAQPSGLLSRENAHGVMYSHGFAALFLGEVYGMTGDDRVKEVVQRAVRLIEKTQNSEGGWRYQPAPVDADISVTICQIMALRAARDAGIRVDAEVIEKAVEYVKNCQTRDGGFSYMLSGGEPSGGSAFPRSAAGVASLYYAGIYEGEAVDDGLEYLLRYKPGDRGRAGRGGNVGNHYFYGHYYAVQTMFLAGGDYWAEWFPAIREELVANQRAEGNWSSEVNDEYSTAMALIILQMPNRYLPVFSGKGPGS